MHSAASCATHHDLRDPLRKAYVRSLVDRIEVDDNVVRIIGDKASLEQAVAHGASTGNAVRSFEPKWRARKDSNL
jgi:site-specific DNA recombinase